MLLRIVLSLSVWLAGTTAVDAARLKSSVTVHNAHILLGDLFEGSGEKADIVVAPAPVPGRQRVYSKRQLAAIARQNGLLVQQVQDIRAVTVRRDGVPLPIATLTEDLRHQLRAIGLPEDRDVIVHTGGRPIVLPVQNGPQNTPPYSLQNLVYDAHTGRFTAVLTLHYGAGQSHRRKLSGRSFQVLTIPVFRNAIHRNEIITDAALQWRQFPAKRLTAGIASTADMLIGQVAKRLLSPGVPVQRRDLAPNYLVRKNDTVTISMQAPGLQLSTLGRAQGPGARGDVVSVKNLSSGRIIEAQVIGQDHVRVGRNIQ